MPPSRKRQSTPPTSSSPVKRATVALTASPKPVHQPLPVIQSRDGSPNPDDPQTDSSEWSKTFAVGLQNMLNPLIDGSLPFSTNPDALAHAMFNVRQMLRKAAGVLDKDLDCAGLPTRLEQATQTPDHATQPEADVPSLVTQDLPSAPPQGPGPLPKTFAQAVGGTPGPTQDSRPPRTHRSRPRARGRAPPDLVKDHVRLIVRPPPSTELVPHASLATFFAKGPSEPFRRLSHALSLSPSTKNAVLLGVHRNQRGNAVITLAPGTPDGVITHVVHVVKTVFSLDGTPPTVQHDVPWSKLLISSVPARPELHAPNPLVAGLKITRNPRWIRNPASITGLHSSFTFAFEDPDGSLSRSLSKSSLFVLGGLVRPKRWIEKSKR
ncbi:hypothetical protein FRC06_000136 [Ceratobasidium sp. 370]|nr:hypothetical protein FRC06_000136 [Ceratobasidium sp. 370]